MDVLPSHAGHVATKPLRCPNVSIVEASQVRKGRGLHVQEETRKQLIPAESVNLITGNLITILRLLNDVIFSSAVHRFSDMMKNVRTIFET